MKILIVGAGPTGLTAALELARQGITPRIVDAKDEPSRLSRAVGILPKSIEVLKRTGASKDIVNEGFKFANLHIIRDSKTLIDLDLSKNLDNNGLLLLLPQDRTESIMSEKLKEMGVLVEYGVKVDDVETTENEAWITFSNGSKEKYDWVIGADGVNSTMREKLGIPFDGYVLDEDWSIADVELNSGFKSDDVYAWLLKGKRNERDVMLMVPIAKNRIRLVSSTPDSMETLPIDIDVKNVRRSGSFKIPVKQAKRYVKGRVALAGDAAHAHSPVGGRGMNLGIEDAAALAESIVKGDIETYEKERHAKAKRIIWGTEFARKSLVSNNPIVVLGIKTLAFLIKNVGFVRKRFFNRLRRL